VFSTCEVCDWIRVKWLRIDYKIVPVTEKLRRHPWSFRQQGWSTPTESSIIDGERRLFDISSVWRPVHESDGGDRNDDQHRDTSTTVEIIWRLKSTTKSWACSAACIRSLAKLSLVTFSITEPDNNATGERRLFDISSVWRPVHEFTCRVVYKLIICINYYNTENIEKISDCFVCFVEGYTPSHLL